MTMHKQQDYKLNQLVGVIGPNVEGNRSASGCIGRITRIDCDRTGAFRYSVDIGIDAGQRDVWEFEPDCLAVIVTPPIDDTEALGTWLDS